MGVYTEYLDGLSSDPSKIIGERKKQLKRIAEVRKGRDILVYDSDLNKGSIKGTSKNSIKTTHKS